MKHKTPLPQEYATCLSINTLALDVHLGVGDEERAILQRIFVDIRFYMPALPSSAASDHGEYICYHTISEKIYTMCAGKEYRLIEFLAMEIYRLVRGETQPQVKLWVKLYKPKILLPYVEKGSSFTYTDLPPFSWITPE